jgi:DNA processing protein
MSSGGAPRTRLTDAQRTAWLRLIRTDNVGPVTFRALLNHYGSAEAALEALPELSRRGGGGRLHVVSVAEAEDEIAATRRLGGEVVALGEAGYPRELRTIEAPPPLVSVLGGPEVMGRGAVAIVGSRNASAAGRTMAERLARGLGEHGLVIASGLARGIDAAAHAASAETGTAAVLAGGLDHVYPPEHMPLLRRILEAGGAALSEMPLGWAPRAQDFPRRNRLISGMSLAVVIVEAARRSGSLHTARFGAERGREVLAVPGSPLDPRTEGCNHLIREGATLITSVDDVLAAIRPILDRPPQPESPFEEPAGAESEPPGDPGAAGRAAVLTALGPTPTAVDLIIRHSGQSASAVMIILIELELAGRLERHPGGLVSLLPGR